MQKKPMRGESAKQVAIDVLREARTPLRAKEIATRVIDSGRCPGLKGKTPEATIAAMLAVGSKPGGPFKRIDKGTYALSDVPATAPATKRSGAKRSTRATGGAPTGTAQAAKATDTVA